MLPNLQMCFQHCLFYFSLLSSASPFYVYRPCFATGKHCHASGVVARSAGNESWSCGTCRLDRGCLPLNSVRGSAADAGSPLFAEAPRARLGMTELPQPSFCSVMYFRSLRLLRAAVRCQQRASDRSPAFWTAGTTSPMLCCSHTRWRCSLSRCCRGVPVKFNEDVSFLSFIKMMCFTFLLRSHKIQTISLYSALQRSNEVLYRRWRWPPFSSRSHSNSLMMIVAVTLKEQGIVGDLS
ncbi:uncharacterized protein [Hemitrygon akajei]|uniref:uncharacterized protein isoform X2 n=1 Tax=Hemitrygon akajei TaxID=2704970 RepID=UPI003BF9BA0E